MLIALPVWSSPGLILTRLIKSYTHAAKIIQEKLVILPAGTQTRQQFNQLGWVRLLANQFSIIIKGTPRLDILMAVAGKADQLPCPPLRCVGLSPLLPQLHSLGVTAKATRFGIGYYGPFLLSTAKPELFKAPVALIAQVASPSFVYPDLALTAEALPFSPIGFVIPLSSSAVRLDWLLIVTMVGCNTSLPTQYASVLLCLCDRCTFFFDFRGTARHIIIRGKHLLLQCNLGYCSNGSPPTPDILIYINHPFSRGPGSLVCFCPDFQ